MFQTFLILQSSPNTQKCVLYPRLARLFCFMAIRSLLFMDSTKRRCHRETGTSFFSRMWNRYFFLFWKEFFCSWNFTLIWDGLLIIFRRSLISSTKWICFHVSLHLGSYRLIRFAELAFNFAQFSLNKILIQTIVQFGPKLWKFIIKRNRNFYYIPGITKLL